MSKLDEFIYLRINICLILHLQIEFSSQHASQSLRLCSCESQKFKWIKNGRRKVHPIDRACTSLYLFFFF